MEDEEDEDDGQSSRRKGSRRSPVHSYDPNSNNKLEKEVNELKLLVAKLEGQSLVKDMVKMNVDTMGVLLSNQKRAAGQEKKSEQPEEPIKAVWSGEGEKAEDDNHTAFAWGCRPQELLGEGKLQLEGCSKPARLSLPEALDANEYQLKGLELEP